MRPPRSRVLHGGALLAELDADLLEAVPAEERPLARRLRVSTITVTRGTWEPPASAAGGLLGLLIASGVAVQCVCADGFTTADLIGAGDVLPARTHAPEVPGGGPEAEVTWQVLERLTAAVLDVRFASCAARWPALTWRLLERRVDHTGRVMARSALVHRQRAEERLLFVLWELAERWGRVTPDGVLVPIPLRHHQLAALAGSLRPSVTLALHRLAARGIAERVVQGYLLRVPLDDALARLDAEPLRPAAAS